MKSLITIAPQVSLATGLTTPSVSEYHYFAGGIEIPIPDNSNPIVWNGIPISPTELDVVAPGGTIHALSDGHHFRQVGWYVTDTNGDDWEYRPPLRINGSSLNSRQPAEGVIAVEYFTNGVKQPVPAS